MRHEWRYETAQAAAAQYVNFSDASREIKPTRLVKNTLAKKTAISFTNSILPPLSSFHTFPSSSSLFNLTRLLVAVELRPDYFIANLLDSTPKDRVQLDQL